MKKALIKNTALILGATLLFSGCGGGGGGGSTNTAGDITKLSVEGKTFMFYNGATGSQYVVDTDNKAITSLDTNVSSNFYMKDKGVYAGSLTYWPDEATGDPKVVMLKSGFDIESTGVVTHENFYYLGHFHDAELAAHSADEFNPDVASANKLATLGRFGTYLENQKEIKEEIQEALSIDGEQLCNFFVNEHHHEEGEDEHEEEEAVHFALTQSGKVYFYIDGESGLEKIAGQSPVVLTGASSCEEGKSGITTSGEDGVYIFLASTQRLYLVDSHGLDFHEHSRWDLSTFMPSGFSATQMIGFGAGDEDHDH